MIKLLTTPILNDIRTFDATEEFAIIFNVFGGNQVVGNNLVVERIDDNNVVYENAIDSFSFTHTIPLNTLENGYNYRVKVRTKDVEGNWSNFSDYKIFWCFSKPTLSIQTIDYDNQNRVYNQTVLFETKYSQSEGELLQSYRYILYNENKDLLKSFPEIYSDGSQLLTQEITGLENSRLYYLEVKTISANGSLGTTELVHFKPFYIAPTLSVALTPTNLPEQGAIKVNANIVQIVLKLYDENGEEIPFTDVEYVDDNWIDMNRGDYSKLIASDGFRLDQDNYLLQLWCKNIPDENIFMILYSPSGRTEFFKRNNRIMAYKYLTSLGYRQYFASNEVDSFNNSDEVSIRVIQDDGLLDIKIDKI